MIRFVEQTSHTGSTTTWKNSSAMLKGLVHTAPPMVYRLWNTSLEQIYRQAIVRHCLLRVYCVRCFGFALQIGQYTLYMGKTSIITTTIARKPMGLIKRKGRHLPRTNTDGIAKQAISTACTSYYYMYSESLFHRLHEIPYINGTKVDSTEVLY